MKNLTYSNTNNTVDCSGSPAPVSCGSPGLFVVNKADLNKRKSSQLSQLRSDREFFRLSERAIEADKKVEILVLPLLLSLLRALFIVSVLLPQFP